MSGFIPPFYTEGGGSFPSSFFFPLVLTSDPTTFTKGYYQGQSAYSQASGNLFFFTGTTSLNGNIQYNWTLLESSSAAVSTLTGNTGGAISPSSGNINIVGSGTTSVAGSGNTLTISSTSSLVWSSISSSQTMATNNGYIVTGGPITLTMPTTAALGDQVAIIVNIASGVTLQAGGSQTIAINGTAQGAAMQFKSSRPGNTVLFICTAANTSWSSLSSTNNWAPN